MALVLLLLVQVRALWLDKPEARNRVEGNLDAGDCRDGRLGTDPVARLLASTTAAVVGSRLSRPDTETGFRRPGEDQRLRGGRGGRDGR